MDRFLLDCETNYSIIASAYNSKSNRYIQQCYSSGSQLGSASVYWLSNYFTVRYNPLKCHLELIIYVTLILLNQLSTCQNKLKK